MDYKVWKYPGGEVGVRLEDGLIYNQTFRVQNSDDFMAMLMAINANKHNTQDPLKVITIPYLPYARQDRVATKGDPLATEVVAQMLNAVGIETVFTFDLHSEKTIYTFKQNNINLLSKSPVPYIRNFLRDIRENGVYLISPDKGATEKTKWYEHFLKDLNIVDGIIQCGKVRDPITGKITGFTVEDGPATVSQYISFVITDDICDGGGTFMGVSDALTKKYGSHNQYLFTTHGIYSQGVDKLLQVFKKIGTTDTFKNGVDNPNVLIYNVKIASQE
jgi:ribose-phosphate pyrophosphokinase